MTPKPKLPKPAVEAVQAAVKAPDPDLSALGFQQVATADFKGILRDIKAKKLNIEAPNIASDWVEDSGHDSLEALLKDKEAATDFDTMTMVAKILNFQEEPYHRASADKFGSFFYESDAKCGLGQYFTFEPLTHNQIMTHNDDYGLCGGCGEVTLPEEDIQDLSMRILPGDTMPMGECLCCGAFAFDLGAAENEAWIARRNRSEGPAGDLDLSTKAPAGKGAPEVNQALTQGLIAYYTQNIPQDGITDCDDLLKAAKKGGKALKAYHEKLVEETYNNDLCDIAENTSRESDGVFLLVNAMWAYASPTVDWDEVAKGIKTLQSSEDF